MKIALFTDTFLPQTNGVVVYLQDLIRVLSREHDVVLVAPGSGPLKVEQPSRGVKIYWVPASPFPFYEGYRMASVDYRRISDILKKEKPDVVHAHAPVLLGLQGIFAAKRRGIPVVVTYHTHFPEYVPHLLNGKLPAFLNRLSRYTVRKLIKQVFKRVDSVTAPTVELTRELRSYGLRNVVHIPNGIDFGKFDRHKKADVEALRRRYGTRGKKVILYAGRISFEKRIDLLLEAFRMIDKKDMLLLIVGSGPNLKQLKAMAKGLGIRNIRFTGFVEHSALSAAYRCADLFASASDTETFGLTFVEAMHLGLPVVGVRKLGAKEVIENGKSGLLVEPGDTAGLAKAMERLLEDRALRRKMGRAARERAKIYSIDKSAEKTLALYKKLILQSRKGARKRLRVGRFISLSA